MNLRPHVMKEVNVELDVTRFVNIDDKPFDIYIGGKLARHFEANEEQDGVVVYVAQVGAKHLVDRVLQEKHQVKDTNSDTPLRRSLFARILPELSVKLEIPPLTPEAEKEELKKILDKQQEQINKLSGKAEEVAKTQEEKIAELEKEIELLKAKKLGRPPKAHLIEPS